MRTKGRGQTSVKAARLRLSQPACQVVGLVGMGMESVMRVGLWVVGWIQIQRRTMGHEQVLAEPA